MSTNIKTDRLLLLPVTQDDAVRINELCNNKNVAAMTCRISYPCSLEETKQWIDTQAKASAEGLQANFAVTIEEPKVLIGVIGLEIEKQHRHAELGYWIGEDYWNQGYASEAVKAFIEYGFTQLELRRIYAYCMKENTASIRVLQKNGMQYEGCLREHIKKDGVFKDLNCYSILYDDLCAKVDRL